MWSTKPPERYPPDDPREWLNRACSNLARAKSRLPAVYLEDLCFDAQQAAEKAIKAILLARGVEFPYVHDIGLLLTLLEDVGESVPETVREAERLNPYATTTRDPDLAQPVSEQEYEDTVRVADSVVRWAEARI